MYYLYIDESGVEGITQNPTKRGLDHDWFTSGGIIVDEKGKATFHAIHDQILQDCFYSKGMPLPSNFKLHYRELRQNQYPYNQLTNQERWSIPNRIFNAINSIDCTLVSATINKMNHVSRYDWPVNVRAYSLLLTLERFQYFLEEKQVEGKGIYERLTNSMRRCITAELQKLRETRNFPFFSNLDKIKGKIVNGNPIHDKVLQFSDFFVYAPHIKSVNNHRTQKRWLEIRDKYYNLNGGWNRRGYVVIE